MIATANQPEAERIAAALTDKPPFGRAQFIRALACILLVPSTVYLLTFVLAASPGPGLRAFGLSKFGPILDYGYEAKQIDANVLVFGDSSAFLGMDPRVVDRLLHTRTAVLPNTIGSLPVTGELVLRRYLEHNRRPDVLVLYFSAWNLNYDGSGKKEFLLEGEEEMLRYGSWTDIARAFRRYPAQFLVFPFQALEPLGLKHIWHAWRHEGAERGPETARAFGHWDYTLPYPALQADCQLRPEYTSSLPHDSIERLKRHYEAEGMRVVIYLAPIPDCTNAAQVEKNSYTDLGAAPPVLLPPGWFANDSFTAHVRPDHVAETSRIFADRLRQAVSPFSTRTQ